MRSALNRTTVLISFLATIGSMPAQRSSDVVMSTGIGPALATTEDRSIAYAAFLDTPFAGAARDVYFSRSVNGGASWSPRVRIDTGTLPGTVHVDSVSLAASGSSVYAIWVDLRNGESDIFCNYSTDFGVTWAPTDVRVCSDTAGAAQSDAARLVVQNGVVHAIWRDERNGRFDLFTNRSLDGGLTWQTMDTQLNTGTSGFSASRYDVASTGSSVYVVWDDDRTAARGVYCNYTSDDGANWLTNDIRLDSVVASSSSVGPSIAVNGADVHVAWVDSRDGDSIYSNHSVDGGATWLANDVRIDHSLGSHETSSPKLAKAGSALLAVWRAGPQSGGDIFSNRSTDGGLTWQSTDTSLTSSAPFTSDSAFLLVRSHGDAVFAAWSDQRNGGLTFYTNYTADAGATWQPQDIRFDNDPAPILQILVDGIASASGAMFSWWGLGAALEVRCNTIGIMPGEAGCPGAAAPTSTTPASSANGFTMACPGFVNACATAPVFLVGLPVPAALPIPLPATIGCGDCTLAVFNSFGAFPDPLVVGPGLPAGIELAAQCACLVDSGGSLCVELSKAAHIVFGP